MKGIKHHVMLIMLRLAVMDVMQSGVITDSLLMLIHLSKYYCIVCVVYVVINVHIEHV